MEGVPASIVQLLLFHTDLKTTLRYTHVDSKDIRTAVDKLNSYNNSEVDTETDTEDDKH